MPVQSQGLDLSGAVREERNDTHTHRQLAQMAWTLCWRSRGRLERPHIYYIELNGEAGLFRADEQAGFMVHSWIKESGLANLGRALRGNGLQAVNAQRGESCGRYSLDIANPLTVPRGGLWHPSKSEALGSHVDCAYVRNTHSLRTRLSQELSLLLHPCIPAPPSPTLPPARLL